MSVESPGRDLRVARLHDRSIAYRYWPGAGATVVLGDTGILEVCGAAKDLTRKLYDRTSAGGLGF
ncbi:MAG: hypothetical protein Q8P61_09070, partial [Candidatus Nanopelagicales bacterium]|nr:hypothetical protein [Candidatus Nanopelagicales bacterium]